MKSLPESVKTILFVLSSKSVEFDREALRFQARLRYPEAAVFFTSVSGLAVGNVAPSKVDLTVDFTPAGARQSWFFPLKIRRQSVACVGRAASSWSCGSRQRRFLYDRVLDERDPKFPSAKDFHGREREIQRQLLKLAGITTQEQGELLPDEATTIARTLPPLAKGL